MIFEPTPIPGVIIVHPQPQADDRGDFVRLWCENAFIIAGYPFRPKQISTSRNPLRHTLRGLHWQDPPHGETKLVRAAHGSIYDVVVDMRADSPAYRHSFTIRLTSEAQTGVMIPAGCAHGFITLSDNAEVTYLIDTKHEPTSARGVRHDDPALAIAWPAKPTVISDRDRTWPLL